MQESNLFMQRYMQEFRRWTRPSIQSSKKITKALKLFYTPYLMINSFILNLLKNKKRSWKRLSRRNQQRQLKFFDSWNGADDIATALDGHAALYAKALNRGTALILFSEHQTTQGTVRTAT